MFVAEGGWWTDEYNVKPIGILQPPKIFIKIPESQMEEVEMTQKRAPGDWVLVDPEPQL